MITFQQIPVINHLLWQPCAPPCVCVWKQLMVFFNASIAGHVEVCAGESVNVCWQSDPDTSTPLGQISTISHRRIWNMMLPVMLPEWLGGPTTLVVLQLGSGVPFVTPQLCSSPHRPGPTPCLQLRLWWLRNLSVVASMAPKGPTYPSFLRGSSNLLKSTDLQQ